MPRTPKGAYVRNTPDWFFRNLNWSSGQVNGGGGGTGLSIQLFNNTQIGEYYYLYGLKVDSSNFQQLYGQVNAGPIGTEFLGTYPVVGDPPTPSGQINTGGTPAGVDLISQPLTWQGDQPTDPWWPGWPIAVIPPGYGFLIYNGFASGAIIATFWWVALQDH